MRVAPIQASGQRAGEPGYCDFKDRFGTTGLKPGILFGAGRGAEAPLFHNAALPR